MKKQVLVMHGAGAFFSLDRKNFIESLKNHPVDLSWFRRKGGDWKFNLQDHLGEEYDVLTPKMPDPDNAQYEAWKVWFEKILAELDDELILVGHSLGGIFLVKYLSENVITKEIQSAHFVAPPFISSGNSFSLPDDLSGVMQAHSVFFYHSKDDAVVPFTAAAQFKEKLPTATFRELDGRGHFNKDNLPEIVEDIKSL